MSKSIESRSAVKSTRAHLIVPGCVVLLGVWLQWPAATRPVPGSWGPQHANASNLPAERRDGVFAMARSAPPVANGGARSAAYASVTPAPPPFAFLGRIMADGESLVLLYRAGRTLTVAGAGRVADDYEVDALLDNLVVLRHLPSGSQQVIELAARDADPISSNPEDCPRD